MNKKISLYDLIGFLGDELIEVIGDPTNVKIDGIVKTGSCGVNKLDWINTSNLDKQRLAEKSMSSVVIVDPSVVIIS